MNKTLDKIVNSAEQAIAKPAIKVLLTGALMFGGYQGVNAQNKADLYKSVQSYSLTVVVEDEKTETLNVEEKVGYGSFARYDKATRHLDIVKVHHPSSGANYSLIYPGDLSWNKGDTLKLHVDVCKDRSRMWTDEQLTENYLGEKFVNAITPERKRYHTGVITDIKDVIPGKQD